MLIGCAVRNRLAEDKMGKEQQTLHAKTSAHFDY